MGFFDDVVGVVKNTVGLGDEKDKDFGDTITRMLDPIGDYAVKKARANDSFEPSNADKLTKLELDSASRRVPSWANPTVKNARWYGDDSAASAAGRKKQQTLQLNRVASTAPSYWSNLASQAAGLKGQSKDIYNQNSGDYWETYLTSSINGIVNSWLGSGSGNSGGGKQTTTTTTQQTPEQQRAVQQGYTYDPYKNEYYAY